MRLLSGPSLEIVLDKPELLIRGSFDEATAVLLSGKLHVHLTEPIRVRSLKLSFTGRIDTVISQVTGANANKDEHREFFSHHWEFLPTQRPPVTWGPHSKTFDFELLLPGDNPETVATSLGKIQYRLMATLERSGFHGNLQTTIPVFVKRGPLSGAPWALALMESIETTGQWDKQLEYRVSVPTRSLKDGELFHTRFELEPRAKGIKLVAVGVLIKEYTRYYSASGEPLHRFAKVVARNENFIGPSGTCSTLPQHPDNCLGLVDATSVQIPMVVPEAYKGIQYDVITDVIETRHRIKFLIKIRDTVGLLHSIFIAVPVSIMPVTARDDSNLLPRYETAVMNPGIVIMRSNTLPPSYDVIAKHQKAPEQNAEAQRPEPLAVEEGVDLDGFPGPLHRSRSQFYLASPDASPPLTPITTVLDTPPEPTSTPPPSEVSTTQPAPASTSASASNNTLNETITHRRNSHNSILADSHHHERRHSNASSRHSTTLHDLFSNNRISDKVRSIFHSRHNSISDESQSSSNRRPMTPVPVRTHRDSIDIIDSRSRAGSVGVQSNLSRNLNNCQQGNLLAFGGIGRDLGDRLHVRDSGEIKSPPEALLHDSHGSPGPPSSNIAPTSPMIF